MMLVGMSGIELLEGMFGIRSLSRAMVGLLILLAWVSHFMMSVNWVIDKPARKWLPVFGSLAGSLGLMLWPVAIIRPMTINHVEILDVVRTSAAGIFFNLPCFLLAIYLVRFHLNAQPIWRGSAE